MSRRKRNRMIEKLRREFPDLTWRYEWPSRWISSAGWEVQAFSQLAPQHDGDDETCRSVYRRSDTGEEVYGLPFGLGGFPAEQERES